MMASDMKVRDGDVWKEYLEILRACRDQIIRENVAEYGNLYMTLTASIALLQGREVEKLGFETPAGFAEMHRRLCVLRKQEKASMTMLRHLWGLNYESEARVVAKRFVDVGLAEHEFVEMVHFSDKIRVIHLGIHDSVHDFAVSEARLHKDVVRAHNLLLDGYSRSHRKQVSLRGGWIRWWHEHNINDLYIRRSLVHHLRGAGHRKEADNLACCMLDDCISRNRGEQREIGKFSNWQSDVLPRDHHDCDDDVYRDIVVANNLVLSKLRKIRAERGLL